MQSDKHERFKAILKALDDVKSNLSYAYKGLISESMTPRNAKSICMIYVKMHLKTTTNGGT